VAFDYAELAQSAVDLITDFGKSVTLVKQNRAGADVTKPWQGPNATEVTFTTIGVVVPVQESIITPQTVQLLNATHIAYVYPDNTYDVRDTTYLQLADGTRLRVLRVDTYEPGTTTLLHVMHLSR